MSRGRDLEGQVAVVTGAGRGVGCLSWTDTDMVRGADPQSVRGCLPGLVAAVGARETRRFEPRMAAVRKGLVGAGGTAVERGRTQRD
ncbi:hypothetical protein GA0115259_103155 [Streptomyces sp. MnatMP-M17]|uniref:hypothetical protein n=1 Tax=Streptomyces sp. MnatMP-M17 TaxID=1839780 RepID=UPI00081EF4F5|nr:hypothetical protein GA0115259_103155 [Streptomyces sp. MnatMP-M17]